MLQGWAIATLPLALAAALLALPLVLLLNDLKGWRLISGFALGLLLGPGVLYLLYSRAVLFGNWDWRTISRPGGMEYLAAFLSEGAMLVYTVVLRTWSKRHPSQQP